MAKHKPDKVWPLRKDGESNGYVRTASATSLQLYYYKDEDNMTPDTVLDFKMSRKDARLLANRILKCLAETK